MEAVARPTMRFVCIKTDDQLDLQFLLRVREHWVTRRTEVQPDYVILHGVEGLHFKKMTMKIRMGWQDTCQIILAPL